MIIRVITSIIIGSILATLIVIPLNAHKAFNTTLSSKQNLITRKDTGITLYDKNGKEFFHFFEAPAKKIIPLSQVPKYTQQAILAIEDQNFYTHPGFSPEGIMRALITNINAGEIVYGGSTLTQQVIKNTLLTPQKSYLRKYQEIALAIELEIRYTKDEILEMYLNTAYFGEGAFGIEEAAQTYFNKEAKDLTLTESALLAGLMPAPSALSPISGNKQKALFRQRLVLQNMAEEGYITLAQKNTALLAPIALQESSPLRNSLAPHFALLVRDELIKEYGENYVARSGLKITTTIDLDLQAKAQEILSTHLDTVKNNRASNGAVVIIDPSSHEVRALVGSKGWYAEKDGKINMATSPRQTGSAFKPIVYATALENKVITPATILHDQPTVFGKDYKPQNYNGTFSGPVYPREALANSLNIPAVEVMSKTGVTQVASLAEKLGITSLTEAKDYNLALALGAGEISLLELTNAFATFANQGSFLPTQVITQIEDKQGAEIAITKPTPTQPLSSATAFIISSILSDNAARSKTFGNLLTTDKPTAVKTGTSQSYKDGWTVGYAPNMAVGVWIGNSNNDPMINAPGATIAGPAWKKIIQTATEKSPTLAFTPPNTIEKSTVCKGRSKEEYFATGTNPTIPCPSIPPKASPTPDQPVLADTKPKKIPLPVTNPLTPESTGL